MESGYLRNTLMKGFLATVEEDGRLRDPVLRENFIERVLLYLRLNHLYKEKLSRRELLAFRRHYKLVGA